VLQPRQGLGLGAEARQVLRAGGRRGADLLDGHDAVQADLPGLEDGAHAAAAEAAQDLIAGEVGRGLWTGGPAREGARVRIDDGQARETLAVLGGLRGAAHEVAEAELLADEA